MKMPHNKIDRKKDTFTIRELNKKPEHCLVQAQLGTCMLVESNLSLTTKAPTSIDLGITSKFQQMGKFTNTKSVSNED